jgi:hypothetical protein
MVMAQLTTKRMVMAQLTTKRMVMAQLTTKRMVMSQLTTKPVMECKFMSNNSQLVTLDNKATLTVLRLLLGLTHCFSQFSSEIINVLVKTNSTSARKKYLCFLIRSL